MFSSRLRWMNWFMWSLSTPSHIPHEQSSWHWSCRPDDIIAQQIRDIWFSTVGAHCRFTNWVLQSWSWIVKWEEITARRNYSFARCCVLFVACWLLRPMSGMVYVEPKLLSQLGNRLQAKMAHISSKYGQVQVFYILWKLSCQWILDLRMSENVFFVSWASRNHSNFRTGCIYRAESSTSGPHGNFQTVHGWSGRDREST